MSGLELYDGGHSGREVQHLIMLDKQRCSGARTTGSASCSCPLSDQTCLTVPAVHTLCSTEESSRCGNKCVLHCNCKTTTNGKRSSLVPQALSAAAAAVSGAAASDLHTGLCCFQCCFMHTLLQYLAVRHPEQVLLLPLTSCSSEGPDTLLQTGLLQQRLCGMALKHLPSRDSWCTRPLRVMAPDPLSNCSPAVLSSTCAVQQCVSACTPACTVQMNLRQ
jgi:hypothetical protein